MAKVYLLPVQIWVKRRREALVQAIKKCRADGREVPNDWLVELRMINDEMKRNKVKL